MIHCHDDDAGDEELETFRKHVAIIDEMYPKIKIDLVLVNGAFSPAMVLLLSEQLSVPPVWLFVCFALFLMIEIFSFFLERTESDVFVLSEIRF